MKKSSLTTSEIRSKSANQTKKQSVQLQPQDSRFEYVTNLQPARDNVRTIGFAGRLRWKTENEGFNTQKWGDYELEDGIWSGCPENWTIWGVFFRFEKLTVFDKTKNISLNRCFYCFDFPVSKIFCIFVGFLRQGRM